MKFAFPRRPRWSDSLLWTFLWMICFACFVSTGQSQETRDTSQPANAGAVAKLKMPDLDGSWDVTLEVPTVFGLWLEVEKTYVIRRSEEPAIDFEIGDSEDPERSLMWAKWLPETRRFRIVDKENKAKVTPTTLDLSADGNSLSLQVDAAELKRAVAESGISEEDGQRYLNQKWRRTEPVSTGENSRISQPFSRPGEKESEPPTPRSPTANQNTFQSDSEQKNSAPGMLALRDQVVTAIPDTPEARELTENLKTQEAAAAAESATIRQLMANGQTEQKLIDEHQYKLTSLLRNAFDLKLRLEELQVKELQSRLSQLERQIGQRKELREKIIARRAKELIEGDALKWTPGSASTDQMNPLRPLGGGSSPPTTSTNGSPQVIAPPWPPQDSLTLSRNPSLIQIRWSGPDGLMTSIGGISFPSTNPTRFDVHRHPTEIQQVDLSFEYPPLLQAALLVGRLDVYPFHPKSDPFLQDNSLPITITKDDLRAAWDDTVVKVIYLADSAPEASRGTNSKPGVETIVSSRLEPNADPIQTARQRGTILAVLRLSKSREKLGNPLATSHPSPVFNPKMRLTPVTNEVPSEKGLSETQPSYQEFAKKLGNMDSSVAEAEEILAAAVRDEGQSVVVDTVPRARRRLEEALRNRKNIQNEYAAILRELELQIEPAQAEQDAAQKNFEYHSQLRKSGVGTQKELDDATLRKNQSSIAVELLKLRRDLFQKAGEGSALGRDAAKTSLPSPEELKAQLEPFARRVTDAVDRVRKLDVIYLRDRSNTTELKRALQDLNQARVEWGNRLKVIQPTLSTIFIKHSGDKALSDSLGQRFEAITKQLAEGRATEADLNAVAESWKRSAESALTAKSLAEKYSAVFEVFGDVQSDNDDNFTYSSRNQSARPQPGYDPEMALAWLEVATGLKLEFVRFDDLDLWFKAGLRVREAGGQYHAGDLIVTLNNQLFESLDQAVEALSSKSRGGFVDIVLSGGLSGHRIKGHFSGEHLSEFLKPQFEVQAVIRFEVSLRGRDEKERLTDYVNGVCVSPEGLVVIPVLSTDLAEGEPIIPMLKTTATAKMVASNNQRGLILVKLESAQQPLFHWTRCRTGPPGLGQSLKLNNNNEGPDSQSVNVQVIEVNRSYGKPREGNDAFAVKIPLGLNLKCGAALTSVVNGELQGVVLDNNRNLATTGSPSCQAIPAVHIQKLLSDFRQSVSPRTRNDKAESKLAFERMPQKLKSLFQEYYPEVRCENRGADGLHFEYDVTTFESPFIGLNAEKQRGPKSGGILCRVELQQGSYAVARMGTNPVPQQFIDRKDYKQLIMFPYSKKYDVHLRVTLSYPRDVDDTFFEKFRQLITSFETATDWTSGQEGNASPAQ